MEAVCADSDEDDIMATPTPTPPFAKRQHKQRVVSGRTGTRSRSIGNSCATSLVGINGLW